MNGWRNCLVVICAIVAAGCGSSGDGGIDALVDAERHFARAAAEEGVKGAFLKYLADDAVIFRPYPVNGREWFQERPNTRALLSWEPVVADLSDAGDLGYTAGPWSYSAEGLGVEPNRFGEYVSVWRKTPQGAWRVVIDVGTSHEPWSQDPSPLTIPVRERRREGWDTVDTASTRKDLVTAETGFARICRTEGIRAAYARFAAENIRYYGDDGFPLTGRRTVLAVLAGRDERRDGSMSGGDVARSGDLGYVYGCGSVIADEPGERSDGYCYLRIWTRGRDRQWTVALDVSEPVPPDAGSSSGD